MSSAVTIADALTDTELLGAGLGPIESWRTWFCVLKGAYGLPLTADELATFHSVTGNRKPPSKRVDELWCVIGRRAGKSKVAAAIATFEGCCIDHSAKLSRGELGHVLVLASTVAQAKVVFGYIKGYIEASPLFSQMVDTMLANEIRLNNNIAISVHPASFRSVRGRTLLCAIFDEVSFWKDQESALPDIETYRAILPSLASCDGLLCGISTPYRKTGLLHTRWRDHYGQDDDAVLVTQGSSLQFNPLLNTRVIDAHSKADPEASMAEWEGMFRNDLAALFDDEVIDRAVDVNRPLELSPQRGVKYTCFVDPSGGRHDAAAVAICHKDKDDIVTVDVVRAVPAPHDPSIVAQDFAKLAKSYGCHTIICDRYSGAWVEEAFKAASVRYRVSDLTKSEIYLENVAYFATGKVRLPDDSKLIRELRLLERRVGRSGKDAVDHPKAGSDDRSNAACGAIDRCQRVKPAQIYINGRTWEEHERHMQQVRARRGGRSVPQFGEGLRFVRIDEAGNELTAEEALALRHAPIPPRRTGT
jgi:hypothetical protein